jgi:uncharacterized protein (TIGR02452 family)
MSINSVNKSYYSLNSSEKKPTKPQKSVSLFQKCVESFVCSFAHNLAAKLTAPHAKTHGHTHTHSKKSKHTHTPTKKSDLHTGNKKSTPSLKVAPFFSWVDLIRKKKYVTSIQAQKVKEAFSKAILRSSPEKQYADLKGRLVHLQKNLHLTQKNIACIKIEAKKCLFPKPQKIPAHAPKKTPAAPQSNDKITPLVNKKPITNLVEVYQETKRKVETIPQHILKPMQEGTVVKVTPLKIQGKSPNILQTTVQVLPMDTIEAALEIEKTTGQKVAALNMANAHVPGGGVEHGSRAQEEDLFRKTALYLALYPEKNSNLKAQLKENTTARYYIPEAGTIYTPNVPVIRHKNGTLRNHAPYPSISFISAAAPNFNYGKPENYKELMKEKIRAVLRTAHKYHQIPLLSAWGCGAFGNDPYEVSGLFKEVFQEEEFKKVFPVILFAIVPGANFDIFDRALNNFTF